jgi:hypothetical protein
MKKKIRASNFLNTENVTLESKSPGISPDPESGQAILIRKIRVLNLADISHVRKLSMMLFSALNRTTRLEQFQLAGRLLEKYQNNFLLATQNSSLTLPAESLFFASAKTSSISLGCSLVTDKSRVPKPAAGITAFLSTKSLFLETQGL